MLSDSEASGHGLLTSRETVQIPVFISQLGHVKFHTDGHRSPTQIDTDFYIYLTIKTLCVLCA